MSLVHSSPYSSTEHVGQFFCTFTHYTVPSVAVEYTTRLFCWMDIAVLGLAEHAFMLLSRPSFVAIRESEGSRPIRDQGESVGRAGQQVTACNTTQRTPCSSVGVEDKSRFLAQFFPQQTW